MSLKQWHDVVRTGIKNHQEKKLYDSSKPKAVLPANQKQGEAAYVNFIFSSPPNQYTPHILAWPSAVAPVSTHDHDAFLVFRALAMDNVEITLPNTRLP